MHACDTLCRPIQIRIPNLTRGLQGAISFAIEIVDEIICSLQGCISNPPARTEKWQSPLWFTYLFYISYPTLSHHQNQWLFLLKFDFAKLLTFLLNEVFQKKITNSKNSPPQKSNDQDSSYLMDAQPVFAKINDFSEYINTEIHLVALKNWIGSSLGLNSCHVFQRNLWIESVVYTIHIIAWCCRL